MPDLPSQTKDKTKPDQVITQKVTTGTPRILNDKNRIGPSTLDKRTRTVRASALDEYVSAGQQLWAANYLRSLMFAVDDVTTAFGDDLYDRMRLDSQVSACLETLVAAVLSQGIQVVPAVKEYETAPDGKRLQNPQWTKAKEIADFVERNLTKYMGAYDTTVAGGLYASLHDIVLCGIANGNRVAEKVFEIPKDGEDAGRLVLKALKVKPRRSTAFVVDVHDNIAGLLSLIPGMGAPLVVQGMVATVDQVPNLLPRRKFCIFCWRPTSADPRGSSILRPAYDGWFVKQQIKIERLQWVATMAGGKWIGTTAEMATTQPILNVDGSEQVDTNGNPLQITPENAMVNSLVTMRNGVAAAFPFGSTVKAEYADAECPFDALLDRQDREISTAISLQTRMGMEAEHGSKADSQTGQDVHGLLINQCKAFLEEMLTRDIAYDLTEYNFGSDSLGLCPTISLSRTEHQDLAANIEAFGKVGYTLAPSQLREVDAMLGLPVRTESEEGMNSEPAESDEDAAQMSDIATDSIMKRAILAIERLTRNGAA